MTTNVKANQNLTQEDISILNIKDLNKKLKQKQISKYEQHNIKKQRRNIKMKKYRKESRSRKTKIYQNLLEQRAQLWKELFKLNQEVTQLRSIKSYLNGKTQSNKDNGDEDEELIVD